MQIVAMSGLSYPAVRATIDQFEAGGWAGIRPALRGRNKGDGRVLSQAQEHTIQRMIIDKRPEQLKMDFSLWSRAAVGQLIEQEFGIKLQVRSIGKYLSRRGFTPQKPIKRAYEQSPACHAPVVLTSRLPRDRDAEATRFPECQCRTHLPTIRRSPELHHLVVPVLQQPC